MKLHYSAVGQTDTWITPRYITEALGEFDLDPCAHTDMPWRHASRQFTVIDDGLSQEWAGRVWLNPPFNQYQIGRWMSRMADHRNGVMLVSAAFETRRFRDYVWGRASGILVMDHRPYFCLPDGSRARANSGQTMCLIAYDQPNLESLIKSRLGPVLTELRP